MGNNSETPLELLLAAHPFHQRLEHIEKHVKEARGLLDVIFSEVEPLTNKLKAMASLVTEFGIIHADAECALTIFGDSQG